MFWRVMVKSKINVFFSNQLQGVNRNKSRGGQNLNGKFKTFGFLDIWHKYKDALKVHIQFNYLACTILYLSFRQK